MSASTTATPGGMGSALLLLGAATMMLQFLWARELGEVFGSDLGGIACTMLPFLAGLAAGGVRAVASRFDARAWLASASFACAAVSIWCARALPAASAGVEGIDSLVGRVLGSAPVLFAAYALGGAALRLLPPAAAPKLGSGGVLGGWICQLDLGSALGALATPLLLLPFLGSTLSLFAASGLLLAAYFAAPRQADAPARAAAPGGVPRERSFVWRVAIVFLAGFGAFALQLIWCRLLGEVLGSTLLLLGIATCMSLAGGALAGRMTAPLLERFEAGLLVRAGVLLWCAAQCAAALLLAWLPTLYLRVLAADASLASFLPAVKALFVLAVLLPPAAVSGVLFPVAAAGFEGRTERLPAQVAALQAALFAGGALGSSLAGFIALPLWGSGLTLAILFAACAAIYAFAFALPGTRTPRGQRTLEPALLLAVLLLAGLAVRYWDSALLGAGVFQWSRQEIQEGVALAGWRTREILYSGDGGLARVTIERSKEQNTAFLRVGGHVEGTAPIERGARAAESFADTPTQLLLALLPPLAGAGDGPTLVIGLGSGSTAAAAVEAIGGELDVVEIEPEVYRALRSPAGREAFAWEAARLFATSGGRTPPRFHFADARAFLHRSERRWQSIICQPSEPWLPWSSALFTEEFYRLAARHLSQQGVMVQWVQLHRIGERELAGILDAYASAFERVEVYHPRFVAPDGSRVIATSEVLLVGGGRSLAPAERLQIWHSRGYRTCREQVGDWIPYPLPILDRAGLERWLEPRRRAIRDLRGRLEFVLPLLAERGSDESGSILRSLIDAGR